MTKQEIIAALGVASEAKELFKINISDHPFLDNVKRRVVIESFLPKINTVEKKLEFFYQLEHFKVVEDEEKIVNISFNKPWVIDNSYLAEIRGPETFERYENDDFIPQYAEDDLEERVILNESERYMKAPAFDYFTALTFFNPEPVSIYGLLEFYVLDNDSKRFYDSY